MSGMASCSCCRYWISLSWREIASRWSRRSRHWWRSARVADGEDNIPRLPLRLDVSARFDHLLQRVDAIDNRPVFSRLDELFQENHIRLRVVWRDIEHYPFAFTPCGP